MVRIISAIVVALWILPTGVWAGPKVGYVDLQRALNSCEAGKKARQELTQRAKEIQQLLRQREEELRQMENDYLAKRGVLDEKAKRERLEQYMMKRREYEQLRGRLQAELQQRESLKTAQILKDLRRLVRRLGRKKGYQVIYEVNQQGVLYAADDLTEELIKLYNRSQSEGGAKR